MSSRVANRQSGAKGVPELSVFNTDLGWFGLLGTPRELIALTIGHAGADEVRAALLGVTASATPVVESDWSPEIRRTLQDYARGRKVDFRSLRLNLSELTPFQEQVVAVTRRIPYGKTLSYGDVAEKAGAVRAARAVGTVMARNRFPIIVPCHRVVASGAKIGGYSGRHGVNLKRMLLQLEGVEGI